MGTDALNQTGVIEEVLPNQMFSVRLGDGRLVRVGLSSPARHGAVRFIRGCSVEVKISPVDPSRGQITKQR